MNVEVKLFLVFDLKLPNFLVLVTPVLTFRLTFMLVAAVKKISISFLFFFGRGWGGVEGVILFKLDIWF